MNKSKLPTIIGMDPPTKEVIIFPNIKEKCIDLFICHADFPPGTKKGKYHSRNFDELKGTADWLRFVDTDAMEMFGNDIVKFAKKYSKITEKGGKDTNVPTCTYCILDGTDACNRGGGRAVDDEICESFMKGDTDERLS